MKSNIEIERDKFEQWAKDNTGLGLWRTEYPFTKPEDQHYIDHNADIAWQAWLERSKEPTK